MDKEGRLYFRITHIESPGDFYVHLQDPNGDNVQLRRLTEGLGEFYSDRANRDFVTIQRKGESFGVMHQVIFDQPGYRRVRIPEWTHTAKDEHGFYRDVRIHRHGTAYFIDYGYSREVKDLENYDLWPLEKR